ncbi:MAG: hypothetical protein CSA66_06765 [Proteobacteria bacterium]|nr:MAG: hypothetical protein CSA66_06765 [Pseudomonadota bacterium]
MYSHRVLFMAALGAVMATTGPPGIALAANENFEASGKLYTKWLYRNNDTDGILWLGNPFWPDNISGDNGVATEFELNLQGKVGEAVLAGVRVKSRFGSIWQDWWENGDISYDQENTSGESLGMNRAQYLKLRGYWIQANLPIPGVETVLVGSSDMAMFNPWTIGKIRYIDRDNGKGIFVQGAIDEDYLRYHAAIIALPKLWVGPGWSTGVGDPLVRIPFYSQDWAYGLKLESDIADDVLLTWITTVTTDSEIDRNDPDANGSPYAECVDSLGNAIPGCQRDGAVDWTERYTNLVSTLEAQIDSWDQGAFNIIAGYSFQSIGADVTGNGVANNGGVWPLVYDDDMSGYFVRARGELYELADNLSLKLEYFNIGEHFQTIFGARREADVLLTDGFIEGGQVVTMNSANEFIDFDEPWYETVIGWHGGTFVLAYEVDLELALEGTFLTYNTNRQHRNVDDKYPDFLHTDGYTDTALYDYANVYDRGRDPRSVYHENMDRMSAISVLKGLWHTRVGAGAGLDVGFKLRFVWDHDERSHCPDWQERGGEWVCVTGDDEIAEDDYTGRHEGDDYTGMIYTGRVWLTYPAFDGFKITAGGQFDWWDEDNRKGTLSQGYGDDTTMKIRPWIDLIYNFQGFALKYRLEYLHKDAQRERDDDRLFNVWRSKASLEVAW